MSPAPGAASCWVGVDVGGSKVAAGVLADDAPPGGDGPWVTRRREWSTPGPTVAAQALEDLLVAAVLEVADGRALAGVGVAAAGFVDASRERVLFAPHLPWRGEDVRRRLADRWRVPVVLENDATAAAYAEGLVGAARGQDPALLVTVGTGIGAGLLVAGELVRGRHGMAGEFGHLRVMPDGHPCPCGGRGCWEQYASGRALERFARDAVVSAPSTAPTLLGLCDGRPERITGRMVDAAAAEGDQAAKQAFASVGEWLGVGLAGLVAGLDPAVVVLGGGVSRAGERLFAPTRAAMGRSLVGAPHRDAPPVVPATLGRDAGLVGAALLARGAVRSA